jgi:hypothetical protein
MQDNAFTREVTPMPSLSDYLKRSSPSLHLASQHSTWTEAERWKNKRAIHAEDDKEHPQTPKSIWNIQRSEYAKVDAPWSKISAEDVDGEPPCNLTMRNVCMLSVHDIMWCVPLAGS